MAKFDFRQIAVNQSLKRQMGISLGIDKPNLTSRYLNTGYNVVLGKNTVSSSTGSRSSGDLIKASNTIHTYGGNGLTDGSSVFL